MRYWRQFVIAAVAVLSAAAFAAADSTNMPPPGTLNYVEGEVSVQGQKQSPKSVGTTYLDADQEMATQNGHAEMLLTPGIYLRMGHDSVVRMISPGLADTQVELTKGSAMLEVDQLFKQNDVSVVVDGATTLVEKRGLYDFNADQPSVEVLDGKAVTTAEDKSVYLKRGREALLAEGQAPVRKKFDPKSVEDDPLYRWSDLRSEYATQANVDASNAVLDAGGWWGAGWYWDPFWCDFAFLPGDGMFWGPFGFPFFSPGYVGWAPYFGYYGGGYGFYHYPTTGVRPGSKPPLAHTPVAGVRGFRALPHSMARAGGPRMGGFGGIRSGEFHSGGLGGFRSGGSEGGFHGGGFGGHR